MAYSPYRKIAQKALLAYGVVETELEAQTAIQTKTNEELEQSIGAKASMEPAIENLATRLNLSDAEVTDLKQAVYGITIHADGNVSESAELTDKHICTFKLIAEKTQNVENFVDLILDVLFTVHDAWVSRCASKFADPKRLDRKFQHLPTELIGWSEAKKDLDFILPIAAACGIKVDECHLENAYIQRTKQFLTARNINSTEGLASYIMRAEYSALTTGVNTPRSEEEAMEMAVQSMDKITRTLNSIRITGDEGRQ